MNKIISLLLCMTLLITIAPKTYAVEDTGTIDWSERRDPQTILSENEWEFRPYKDTTSTQNPPDFSWPLVEYAESYDLIVCSDVELKNIKYKKDKIINNFYNFNEPFKKGEIYYWSVRFNSEKGTSKWSEPSRFLLSANAHDYRAPKADDIINKIKECGHPRLNISEKSLDEMRKAKEIYPSVKSIFDKNLRQADQITATGIIKEPPSTDALSLSQWSSANKAIMITSYIYILTGDAKYGNFAKKQLLEMCDWDIEGTTAYKVQDQRFRETLVDMAYAYDYIYDLLSKEERSKIIKVIRERMIILENPQDGLSDAVRRVNLSPYLSHGWTALGYLLCTSIATMGEIPEAEFYMKKYLPLFINLQPPFSNEDGGWAQGISYWSYFSEFALEQTIKNLTGYNLYGDKAYYQNVWKLPVYLMNSKNTCEFGDESYGGPPTGFSLAFKTLISFTNDKYIKWKNENINQKDLSTPSLYFANIEYEKTKSEAPLSKPNSAVFKDIGWVSMQSDIIDENNRVSLYFKSSPYGAFNHSHADQNSFHIQAFGERLAIDSGYYDYYHSPFDMGYTRKTYAHNAITYDGGVGQPPNIKSARGKITNFLTTSFLDLASGDATRAYNVKDKGYGVPVKDEVFDKSKRHIIYIRPDKFIVIDDLKFKGNKKGNFEWWLNAYEDLSLYSERDGARIQKGDAVLDAKVQYPKVQGYYSDIFSGPDLNPLTPTRGYETNPVHKRVWFETEKLNKTKMVTTLDVRHKKDDAPYTYSEEKDGYIYLSFEDGTKAYIRTSDEPFDTGKIKTDALAVILQGDNLMFVDGTYLIKNKEEIIKSSSLSSIALGNGEIGISSEKDNNIEIKTSEILKLTDCDGIKEEKNQNSRGFNWDYKDGKLKANIYNGYYSYLINDRIIPGTKTSNKVFDYKLGDAKKQTTLKGYYNQKGDEIYNGQIENEAGFYMVDDMKNINLLNAKKGDMILLSKNTGINSKSNDISLSLTPVTGKEVTIENINDFDSMKAKADAFKEAEDFTVKQSSAKPYTSRPFLSNKTGLSDFNKLGDTITWEFNVPEDGKYDLVIKYVGFSGVNGQIKRMADINGEKFRLDLFETGSYGADPSEWISARIKSAVQLKKGKNKITIYPIEGNWNMDWLALIKSDKK